MTTHQRRGGPESPVRTVPARRRRPVIAAAAALVAVDASAGAAGLVTRVVELDPRAMVMIPAGSTALAAYALVIVVVIPMAVLGVLAAHGRAAVDPVAVVAGGLLAAWSALQLVIGIDGVFVQAFFGVVGIGLAAVGVAGMLAQRTSVAAAAAYDRRDNS